jgi:Uma2 family endonuclease
VSAQEPEERLTVEEYLAVAPDTFGDVEIVDGLVVRSMAQSELHSLVVRRLSAALENARLPDGPCLRVSSDVGVRFADAESSRPDHRLNARYPDVFVRDCEPYDVNTVRNHIRLIVEVTSESTFKADTTEKRVMYAAAGIPSYLVVHFDKDWGAAQRDRGVPSRLVGPPVRRSYRPPARAYPGRAAAPHSDIRGSAASLKTSVHGAPFWQP